MQRLVTKSNRCALRCLYLDFETVTGFRIVCWFPGRKQNKVVSVSC